MNEVNCRLSQNMLFNQAKLSKFKLNIFTIIPIYFFLWLMGLYTGRFIAIFIINSLRIELFFGESTAIVLRRFIICGLQILIIFLWVKLIEKRPIKTIGFQANKPFKDYSIGCMVGFLAITAVTVTLYSLDAIEFEAHTTISIPLILVAIAFGWIIQSASEEIAIRGWLIPSLGYKSNPIMSIIITSVIFGILHLFSSGVTILSFINLILSGVFFAVYAIYTDNIWGVCGLHFTWNFTLGNIYGFSVSGFPSNGATILRVKQIGSAFLTGGDFGPEGGFITTLILLLGICVLVLKLAKKIIRS